MWKLLIIFFSNSFSLLCEILLTFFLSVLIFFKNYFNLFFAHRYNLLSSLHYYNYSLINNYKIIDMAYRVAINGFGRIGRLTLRALLEKNPNDIEVVAINDLGKLESNLHLFKYDSVHGTFTQNINKSSQTVKIGNNDIQFLSEPDPININWSALNIDLVVECTGFFTKRDDAQKHLSSGSKKVLISAPATDPDITVVYGINHNSIKKITRLFQTALVQQIA